MLKSIHIQNYRNLSDLEIKSLGAVNLFTGRNNTGKTTLLEAIAIFTSGASRKLILEILNDRGELFNNSDKNSFHRFNRSELNFNVLLSLFSRESFFVRPFLTMTDNYKTVTLSIESFYDTEDFDLDGNRIHKRVFVSENSEIESTVKNLKYAFVVSNIAKGVSQKQIFVLEDDLLEYNYRLETVNYPIEYIGTRNLDREINGILWDRITLTDKEQHVINALRIIEPKTERINFIENSMGDRSVVIKIAETPAVLPLKSMGDGINRILTIILALVNAENGYLLIDEFENGLHYSVQEQLWKIIFELSAKLNVQVFVTTHSEDSIRGFEQVLNDPSNKTEGKLIRLDNVNGEIQEVEYTASDLKIATDNDIEVR